MGVTRKLVDDIISGKWRGSSDRTHTYFCFLKIGDDYR